MPVAQRNGDVARGRVRLGGAGGPGVNCDDGQAGEQQDDGEGVQRLVEGERVVDGRRGAQVARC